MESEIKFTPPQYFFYFSYLLFLCLDFFIKGNTGFQTGVSEKLSYMLKLGCIFKILIVSRSSRGSLLT